MNWHEYSAQAALREFDVTPEAGLKAAQVTERQEKYGKNQLRAAGRRSTLQMFLEQFKDVMVLILLVAAIISGFALKEWTDCIIILLVVVLNAVLGVVQENRAENALEALKKMSSPHAKVRRDGAMHVVPAEELVPGDIVVLETGDAVPADLRLIESVNLQLQESALTGESNPVEKQTEPVPADAPLGDRRDMAYSGSLVTYGRGTGVVTATGMDTEIGRIAGMLDQSEGVKTPLQRRLADMSKKLAILCLAVCAVVFGVGVLEGRNPIEMFMTAISLAVAAIPEGMLAIVTIVLALGVQRMSERNAIIRRLPAVETLGSATVICSDKTGTLTLNRMTVAAAAAPFEAGDSQNYLRQSGAVLMSTAMALCNDAQPGQKDGQEVFLGDPTETALSDYVKPLGYEAVRLVKRLPRVDEVPFDSQRKMMTTVHKEGNRYRVFVKGGLDEVLAHCTKVFDGKERPLTDADVARIRQTAEEMSNSALRVLVFAMGQQDTLAEGDKQAAYERELTFLGMVGMIDPPRPTAREAVRKCLQAGIKPVMITGDHKLTAAAIAKDLGILGKGDRVITGAELERMDDDRLREEVRNIAVYARVSPEHKLRIVRAWQSWGDVVAMTGDGVNDAPALKQADIGVAMGITGTEVSKEASAMILIDDNFATIVEAVGQGRTLYSNILKAIQFLLSSNLGEVLTVFVAVMLNWDSPLLPIHILWVNLITDSLPALALGMEPAEPDVMRRPPRDPKAAIFDRPLVFRLAYQGLLIALCTLAAYRVGCMASIACGQTMAFAVLSGSQIVHSFNLRSNTRSLFSRGPQNRWMFLAGAAALALQLLVLFVPFLRDIFRLAVLTPIQWAVVILLALVPLAVVEAMKALGLTGEHWQKTA